MLNLLVEIEGIEKEGSGLGNNCSIHLSYRGTGILTSRALSRNLSI